MEHAKSIVHLSRDPLVLRNVLREATDLEGVTFCVLRFVLIFPIILELSLTGSLWVLVPYNS